MRWNYIIAGVLLLACGSYLDNSRGILLPVITRDFGLSYSQSSWFFIAGNFGAVFATFALLPLTQLYNEKNVSVGLGLTAIAGLLFGKWVTGFYSLIPFAVFLGSLLAVYGALSNLYVIHGTDIRNRSRILCGLHMVYGLTSIVAPQLTGQLIESGFSWKVPLWAILPLVVFIAAFIQIKIPKNTSSSEQEKTKLKMLGFHWLVILVFCVYVAGEVLTSMWMVTYLVESEKLPLSLAARYLSGFFVLMTATRGLCFFSLSERLEKLIVALCLVISAIFFSIGHQGYYWGFSMAGILGPFFPLMLGRSGRVFGEQSKEMTLWILGSVQLTLALSHLFVGKITDSLGITQAYWIPCGLIGLASIAFLVYLSLERKMLARA